MHIRIIFVCFIKLFFVHAYSYVLSYTVIISHRVTVYFACMYELILAHIFCEVILA